MTIKGRLKLIKVDENGNLHLELNKFMLVTLDIDCGLAGKGETISQNDLDGYISKDSPIYSKFKKYIPDGVEFNFIRFESLNKPYFCINSEDYPNAVEPVYMTGGSAGADFFCAETTTIEPGEVKIIPTGVSCWMKDNQVLLLYLRSSMFKRKIMMANSVGVIDCDYAKTGNSIGFIIYNYGSEPVTIEVGERIGQGIITEFRRANGSEVGGERSGGFGSTGT